MWNGLRQKNYLVLLSFQHAFLQLIQSTSMTCTLKHRLYHRMSNFICKDVSVEESVAMYCIVGDGPASG